MIGIIVILICLYRYIFSDWSLTGKESIALGIATFIEMVVEIFVTDSYFDWKDSKKKKKIKG